MTIASVFVQHETKCPICWQAIKMVVDQSFVESGRDIWFGDHEIFL
jgi:hypothetical protein